MRVHRDLRPLVAAAQEQGWSVGLNKSSHLSFTAPTGARITAAGTPSDVRGRHNLLADLRRLGLIWPPGRKVRPCIEPKITLAKPIDNAPARW